MSAWDDLGTRDSTSTVAAALQIKLDSKIQLLCDIHNRKLSDEARLHWLRELLKYASGRALWRALEAGCNEQRMPSIAWILEHMQGTARQDVKPFVQQPAPTPEQEERSARAAIKSMLWLHYAKGFAAKDIAGIIGLAAARLFMTQTGRSVEQAVEDAKILPGHDRDSILAWMSEQEAMGH